MSVASVAAQLSISQQQGNDALTKFLMTADGADTGTGLVDSSSGAHTITPVGNAQIDTAQFKFGGASCRLDGTGDYLTLDGSADFAYGTGDFSIDFWARFALVIGTTQLIYDSRPLATNGLYPTIYLTSNTLRFFQSSADRITGATAILLNTWYHIAVTREGTSTRMFLNGTQEGSTYSDSNDYLNGASRPVLGEAGFSIPSNPMNGWLEEVRVSKGVARWTTTFTPPAQPYC